jgi:hypothetical protein
MEIPVERPGMMVTFIVAALPPSASHCADF